MKIRIDDFTDIEIKKEVISIQEFLGYSTMLKGFAKNIDVIGDTASPVIIKDVERNYRKYTDIEVLDICKMNESFGKKVCMDTFNIDFKQYEYITRVRGPKLKDGKKE